MILVVDDDPVVRSSLSFLLRRAGYEPECAASAREALSVMDSRTPELVLSDMNFTLSTSGEEGLDLLRRMKSRFPDVPVMLMTAWGSISLAVEGMKAGAIDFVTKPWDNILLLDKIRTVLELGREAAQSDVAKGGFDGIVGRSPLLREVLDAVSRIAPTDASVLVTGESGTGKELVAEAIHRNSRRSGGPFVKVNLGGLSHTLFESEMFGHRKGAFTDAYSDRTGRFEAADKGTIFLDEIGELDPVCQVKLLRVLQDRTFEKLGESRPRKVDVRVITATNRSLQQMVAEGTFREDLYYRINLIPLRVPALRERREDIPLLVRYFADALRKGVEFDPEAMELLSGLPYPGNIRELKNLVERTILISGKDVICREDVARCLRADVSGYGGRPSGETTLARLERDRIAAVLSDCDGNVTRAALALGISRQALYRRIEKMKIRL